jgi:hypothetical protein
LVGKPEGKRTLVRPRRRWEYNIRIDVKVIMWEVVGWMHLAWESNYQRTVVNTVMNLRVP